MWPRVRAVAAGAFGDLSRSWRTLAITDLAYKAIAFAVLTPATALLLRWLLARTGSHVVADADIARFFFTTPSGIVALLAMTVFGATIAVLESGCLMAVGLATEQGSPIDAKSALAFGAKSALAVLRLAFQMVIRVIPAIVPFVLAIGLVYATLLREHDINYYLARRPSEFVVALVLAGVIVAALAWLVIRTVTRWALSLPLVLFENVNPRHALRESSERSRGDRTLIGSVLAIWAAIAIAIGAAIAALVELIARVTAPHTAGSLAVLLAFLTGLVVIWIIGGIAASIFNTSLFALLIVRLWRTDVSRSREVPGQVAALPRGIIWSLIGAGLLIAAGFVILAFGITRRTERVLIIAHRGASADAPENTLAAFRTAVAQGADLVELDVQESVDGEVVVAHDKDLMKIGGSPMRIWEHTAAELRTVDIGKGEHVPTLAEALAVCKGTPAGVLVELKSYGHAQHLEERVAQVVESAGMVNACAYMSLDHNMVRTMKGLRPSWRVGALVAKTLGDPVTLGADFLAIEARTLTPLLVRRAHRAGQDVYVWTVNDPAWILASASRGSDGVITNYPAVAKDVLHRRAAMTDAQRLLIAVLIRSGTRTEDLESDDALRP